MFEHSKKYLSYILNPLELLRTKKVLQVNPTVAAQRIEPDEVKIFVYDYDVDKMSTAEFKKTSESLDFINTPGISWINVDGLRKTDVEAICAHYGIHYLITEDIKVAIVNKTDRYANNKINNTNTIEKILALKVPVLIPTNSSSSRPASPVIDTLTGGTSAC